MKKFKNLLKIGLLGLCVPFMFAFSGCSLGGKEDAAIYIVSLEKTETPDGVVFDITYSDGSSEFFTIEKAQDGKDGKDGKDGSLVDTIRKTDTKGNVDIYTIFFKDG